MKKGWIIIAILAGVIVLLVLWGIKVNNNMVAMEENVNKSWSNVENVYQRRADLIPNLVASRCPSALRTPCIRD